MPDPQPSTATADPASRQKVIADLIAPYSVTEPDTGHDFEDPVVTR